jgi:hypothetical protein
MMKGDHLLQQFEKTLERLRLVITWYVHLLGGSAASLLAILLHQNPNLIFSSVKWRQKLANQSRGGESTT